MLFYQKTQHDDGICQKNTPYDVKQNLVSATPTHVGAVKTLVIALWVLVISEQLTTSVP